MTRFAAVLLAAALAACTSAPPEAAPADASGTSIEVNAVPVELRPGRADDKRLGALTYAGGVALVSPEEDFGGLSGLSVSEDGSRFIAITDQGNWVTGRLTYDDAGMLTGISEVRMAPLRDAKGAPLSGKSESDAEEATASAPGKIDGTVYVSLERHHRVLSYDIGAAGLSAPGLNVPAPAAIAALPENDGLEALTALADGRLFAAAEAPDSQEKTSPAWLIDPAAGAITAFAISVDAPYAHTGAALGPDGQVYLIERRFSPALGVGAQIRRFDPRSFAEGAVAEGTLVARLEGDVTVDNMEGIALYRGADGRTRVLILSDDNFNRPLQRSLLMQFVLAD